MTNLREYIGIPYSRMNCWDLAVKFYKDQFDIDLKHIYQGPVPSPMERENLIFSHSGSFEKVTVPQYGDLVVIRIKGVACHVGIFIAGKMMLHSMDGMNSVFEPMGRYLKMIEGYYRHVEKK